MVRRDQLTVNLSRSASMPIGHTHGVLALERQSQRGVVSLVNTRGSISALGQFV